MNKTYEKSKVLDFPNPEGELKTTINRYSITNPGLDQLLIKTMPSNEGASFFSFVIFGGMGSLFVFLALNGYKSEGFDVVMLVYLVFAVLMLSLGMGSLVLGYFLKPYLHFKKAELSIGGKLMGNKSIAKESVVCIFISKTFYKETANPMPDNFSYQIMIKVRKNPGSPEKDLALLTIENRDNLGVLIGVLDTIGMIKAESDALEIAQLMTDFWKIPFKA